MSAIDQPRQPQWHRVVDFPLTAMLLAILLYVTAAKLGYVVGNLVPVHGQPATAAVHAVIMLGFVVPMYKLGISRLGEQRRDDLRGARALPDLGKGIAAGALLFGVVAAVAAILGAYRITGRGDPSGLLMPLITSAIMPAFMEELMFRGILFRWLEEFGGSWAALAITSVLFGLAHSQNPGATWFSSFAIAAEAGLMLGGVYMLTRSLWMPIGLHAAWNFTQGPILGVPVSGNQVHGIFEAKLSGPALVSGGAFGLEASVIAVAVCVAAGTWFIWLAASRGELMPPWWARRRLAAED
jgi:membrane protease YdiL (CAAX protease family)